MKHLDLSLRMLTGRERNVLKKSAKTSSSSRIIRFVEPIISIWGEKKTLISRIAFRMGKLSNGIDHFTRVNLSTTMAFRVI